MCCARDARGWLLSCHVSTASRSRLARGAGHFHSFSEFASENELLNILNPLIKSESIWKPHALYLMAEFYFSKNKKQRSKEFFEQIIALENINSKIKLESQNRLSANFSE